MSYDRYERRQAGGSSSRKGVLGYWLPLALTVTAATVGIAVWIWNERKDDDSDNYDRDNYDRKGDDGPSSGAPSGLSSSGPRQAPHARRDGDHISDGEGMLAKMSGALRRTPSPQQLFENASRQVVAGVAAAGAVVGGALSSIREEDQRDFKDHNPWSDEAESRAVGAQGTTENAPQVKHAAEPPAQQTLSSQRRPILSEEKRGSGKQKKVAIVVSADYDSHDHSDDISYHQEHASILSHLPQHINAESRLFVLIYAPDLKEHPLATNPQVSRPPFSGNSSYSAIDPGEAQDPGEEHRKPLTMVDPVPLASITKLTKFEALYKEAQALVANPTMIMPFTSQQGHIHLLRHIEPEIVYIQETLSGNGGDVIPSISKWVGQIVLVVGDESGHGGLVDSEDERGNPGESGRERWWQDDPRIGLGKGVEVVEGLRVGEDWRRRVGGHD